MVAMTAIWTALGLAGTAHAQDCDAWGTIGVNANPSTFVLNETYTFFVEGGNRCGEVAACEWSLDEANAVGELLETTGGSVTYLAPATLEDCIPVSFQIFLLCPDAPGGRDAVNVTVQCTQADKDELLGGPGTSVSGGGCTQPTSDAWLLVPAIWGLWGRRRRAQRDLTKGVLP